jgi:D-amino peptidase
MRLSISADIEGIAGIVTREQGRAGGFEYEQARTWMTDSVLAVCAAARERGVTEVVVSDSHGNGHNLQLERMPDYVQLVRSWPRPLGMMQGIEVGPYVGAALVGYHAGSTNVSGVLAHTLSSEFFQEIRLNGRTASEAVLSAALAGQFSVPILMIAGDDTFVAETQALLGDIPSATLKSAYGNTSAMSPSLGVAQARLQAATREGLAKLGAMEPYRIDGTVEVGIRLRTRSVAEWLAFLPEVERTDAFSVRYHAADIVAASRFLMFVTFAKSAVS